MKRSFKNTESLNLALRSVRMFNSPGITVLVDGQYGSTGKGLMASVLGEYGAHLLTAVVTNAGPNSGHTAYDPFDGSKVVTQQIPVASVIASRILGGGLPTFLNGGAIIDANILAQEVQKYMPWRHSICVHPHAATIGLQDVAVEASGTIARIASTGKGVGAALARKLHRDPSVAFENAASEEMRRLVSIYYPSHWDMSSERILVETAQGFSLGLHSGFFPATTSRECTVAQALADARLPVQKLEMVVATYRTFPIRVGNTEQGHSGGMYSDQRETSWEEIGQEPEITTVTKRVRRVFTWSRIQFRQSLEVNRPDVILLNFMQYLKPNQRWAFYSQVLEDYRRVLDRDPKLMLCGYGPNNSDVRPAVI